LVLLAFVPLFHCGTGALSRRWLCQSMALPERKSTGGDGRKKMREKLQLVFMALVFVGVQVALVAGLCPLK
jgi:hypothetical protein